MSQLTALREQTRPLATSQKWSVTVHSGPDAGQADAVVGDLVAPLAAQARMLGADRWYFDRHIGSSGRRVEAHFFGNDAAVERLQRFYTALSKQLPRDIARLPVDEGIFVEAGNFPAHAAEAADAHGSATGGVRPAEKVRELSSDLAVWASQRFSRMQNRSAMAALLLSDSARAMLRGPRSGQWPDRRRLSWDYYWDSHLEWCTAELGQNGSRERAAMAEQVSVKARPMQCLMAATASDSAVQTWRRRWSGSIDNFLSRAHQMGTRLNAHDLTLHQAQMMLNRLGFNAREEAVLGLYARTWTEKVQTQLVEASRS